MPVSSLLCQDVAGLRGLALQTRLYDHFREVLWDLARECYARDAVDAIVLLLDLRDPRGWDLAQQGFGVGAVELTAHVPILCGALAQDKFLRIGAPLDPTVPPLLAGRGARSIALAIVADASVCVIFVDFTFADDDLGDFRFTRPGPTVGVDFQGGSGWCVLVPPRLYPRRGVA